MIKVNLEEKTKLILIELSNGDAMLVDILDIVGFYIKRGVCCARDCDNAYCYIDSDYSVCENCQHYGYALQIMVDTGKHYTIKLYEHEGDALDGLSLLKNQIYGVSRHEIQEVTLSKK